MSPARITPSSIIIGGGESKGPFVAEEDTSLSLDMLSLRCARALKLMGEEIDCQVTRLVGSS